MLREIESSAAFLMSVTLHDPEPGGHANCGWAEWNLPGSKTDPVALGTTRSLGCACPSPLCPAAAMRRVVNVAKEVATRRGVSQCADWPLLVKCDGAPLLKHEVVSFYSQVAELVGATGLRITGHSARVAGAMRMARAGHAPWVIQVFGRWGSEAVLLYVREAILGERGGNVARLTEEAATLTLQDLKGRARQSISDGAIGKGVFPGERRASVGEADACVESVATEVLPLITRNAFAAANVDTEILGRLDARLLQIEGDLRRVTRLSDPAFVRNLDGNVASNTHAVASAVAAHCGWPWSSRRWAIHLDPPSSVSEYGWCRRCAVKVLGSNGS